MEVRWGGGGGVMEPRWSGYESCRGKGGMSHLLPSGCGLATRGACLTWVFGLSSKQSQCYGALHSLMTVDGGCHAGSDLRGEGEGASISQWHFNFSSSRQGASSH